MLLRDYCQAWKELQGKKNYGTICPFPRQQMYNGPVSNRVPVDFMAMPGSLKENILTLFTTPACVPKRKSIFRDEYCQCIGRAQASTAGRIGRLEL